MFAFYCLFTAICYSVKLPAGEKAGVHVKIRQEVLKTICVAKNPNSECYVCLD